MKTLLLLLILVSLPLLAEQLPPVFNPFATPALSPDKSAGPDGISRILADGSGMELRAVLTGGNTGLANIDGNIIAVGEEYKGYRLIAVSEKEAILQGKRARIQLPLKSRGNTENKPDNDDE